MKDEKFNMGFRRCRKIESTNDDVIYSPFSSFSATMPNEELSDKNI